MRDEILPAEWVFIIGAAVVLIVWALLALLGVSL